MSEALRQVFAQAIQVSADTIPHDAPLASMARLCGYRLRRLRRDEIRLTRLTYVLIAADEQGDPCAIRPSSHGPMLLTANQPPQPVSEAEFARLQPDVFALYAIFPSQPLTLRPILSFIVGRARREIIQLGAVSVGAALMSLLIPLVTSTLFEFVIPLQDRRQWVVAAALLAIGTVSLVLFQLIRELLVLRIQGRLRDEVTFALWDRFLSLSPAFIRRFAAGDLVERLRGIDSLQSVLIDGCVSLSLAVVLCVFNGLFMAWINVRLTLVAVLLTGVAVSINLVIGLLQLPFVRQVVALQGQSASYMVQVLNGLAKLKAGGALETAYAHWIQRIDQQQRRAVQARTLRSLGLTFNGAYPILAALILFTIVWRDADLDAPTFIAFNVAYTQFLLTGLQLASVVIQMFSLWPLYERLAPLLTEPVEHSIGGETIADLQGHIHVEHVSFSYGSQTILSDVSLDIPAGSFVALVGAYGSGKSTLLRLLLGFESPHKGTIAYDDIPLTDLDLEALRRQWGVVLQNGQVLAGDLYQNINVFGQVTLDEAWESVRLAGLADDIQAMPMGLFTYLGEEGANLSGGQRQRVLLARALAARPRILFLDEATSALDETVQAEVIANLSALKVTRFVIAHRLSTIKAADIIYVLDQGCIVEQGTLESLMAQNGVFARMVQADKKQILHR